MDIVKVLKYFSDLLKSRVGIFALVILVMAGVCLEVVKASTDSGNQTTVQFLVGGCLVIILITLGIAAVFAIKNPEAFGGKETIAAEMFSYCLRGLRYDYLRSHDGLTIRINVMQPVDVNGNKALCITLMDYREEYSDDERNRYWGVGRGKCGEAWQMKEQRYYDPDDRAKKAALAEMDDQHNSKLNSLQSVLSTPIVWEDKCIGILNLDSVYSGRETGVNDAGVQALFREAAQLVAPALSILARTKVKPSDDTSD